MGVERLMSVVEDLFTTRKSLDEICTIPDRIISVYSLEQHVWANSNAQESRRKRTPELQTIVEFQIDPVRPFLNDILRNMAAPYKQENKEHPIGQGYWIQAEFGSGKSHLLCFLASLALGNKDAWELVKEKEQKSGRGKRESLYQFWEEGLESKSSAGKKGIFVIVKTLVGVGGGVVGITHKGDRLIEYILDAAKEQMQLEFGKNLSIYPAEILADRFITQDYDRFRNELKKFLRDPNFFEEDEFEDVEDFIKDIQQNKSPQYKRSCGDKLWRFYTEYLKMQPQIPGETEEILMHLVQTIMDEGYSGVLLVLDEVSLFMKDRDDEQRVDDEKTLVVLSNRLAKVHNLPIWTVCSAQQAIESKMGAKNIIADDRLKLVKLLEEDKDYYKIVLSRVREIKDPSAIANYFRYYKDGFSWPASIGEQEFNNFFPFHKPAIEVLRAITYELTTARSAIHFMHQTLKYQIKNKGRELVRLWELFDEAVQYEEDPSGVNAGLAANMTNRETDYRAYEVCKRQIESLTHGYLKVYRDKAIKTIQTLFLYHVARIRQQGLTPEELANSVLIERDEQAKADENNQHYETLADNLKKELHQIVESFDGENNPRYRFDPVITGIDPRQEFRRARDEAESNEVLINEAWAHLLCLKEWPVKTRKMTIDLSDGVKSVFCEVAPASEPWMSKARSGDQIIELFWDGRQISGIVGIRDLGKVAIGAINLPGIDSDRTEQDFALYIGMKPVSSEALAACLKKVNDSRVLFWVPGELTSEERNRLLNFAAYRKLVSQWQGKETEDAIAVINWVADALKTELGTIAKIVDNSYARGRIDARNNSQMDFHMAGGLSGMIEPLVARVLNSIYISRDIKFEAPFKFQKEDGVKVINGIVKTGLIPKGAKPNQYISAAQNYGYGLKIMKKGQDRQLETSDNPYVRDLWTFIDGKLTDAAQTMKVETLYMNFMGVGGPKDYGLTRRMVQIYLLCLAQQGKVRVGLASKAGLSFPAIDYANIADIDFSVKILDALTTVQKVEQPANWEVLRPYAEKLLQKSIPATNKDEEIAGHRKELKELFAREKDESERTANKARLLFGPLRLTNPYDQELRQTVALFDIDLSSGNDIDLILYSLKQAMGYQAFDSSRVMQEELDDLAIRLQNYYDLRRFLDFDAELRIAQEYCQYAIPDFPALKDVRQLQQKLSQKLANLQAYIDSEVKLKTDLLGKIPPMPGDAGSLGALIYEYSAVYKTLHDTVSEAAGRSHEAIRRLIAGDDLRAFEILDGITALQPGASSQIKEQLQQIGAGLFDCSTSLPSSVEQLWTSRPEHECGLSFRNAECYLQTSEKAVADATNLLRGSMQSKFAIFLSPAVRERLEQGRKEPAIGKLLACRSVSGIQDYLVPSVIEEPDIVQTINRFLKHIVIKKVKMSDFKPGASMVEREQIAVLEKEFVRFLEAQFSSIENDGDVLPILKLE
jgi:hypothetical protein